MKANKKRNPQDSTRRNIQAANKQIAALKKRVESLEADVLGLFHYLGTSKIILPIKRAK